MLVCRIFGAPVTLDIFRRRYQFFGLVIYLRTFTCIVSPYCFNTIHAEISARCLAENTSVNPKQCRKIILNAKRCN